MSSGYIYLIIAGVIVAGAGIFVIMLRMTKKSAYDQGRADQREADLIEINRLNEEAKKIREGIDNGTIKVGDGL